MNKQILATKHNFINETKFRIKSYLLIARRMLANFMSPVRLYTDKGMLAKEAVIAHSEGELWYGDYNNENWILTAGKIENLRIATRKINGIEVKANEVFSFWKHIGNPNIGQGYVVGREIREGCIVPTVSGGLCQLSNALYDCALKANFEIIERHKHTKVIKGSLAEKDRDATVKWNYVDLRFKAKHDFRIEVELTADKLIVVFRSKEMVSTSDFRQVNLPTHKLNDCYSCGNTDCFKHPGKIEEKYGKKSTTFILDEKWPEYESYIQSIATEDDFFILPMKRSWWNKSNRYEWAVKNKRNVRTTTAQALWRAIKPRLFAKMKTNVFEQSILLDYRIAIKASQLIPVSSTHVIVSQNLLPHLYAKGALGGRSFDVLMTRLPMDKLHERLDTAYANYPHSTTLSDFRASEKLTELENKALTRARRIITPHADIASLFKNKVVKLDWAVPVMKAKATNEGKILFPASSLGRKGAYEMRRLAREVNLSIVVAGNAIEEEEFWEGMKVERFHTGWEDIRLVIYPTYIEHQPRKLLQAIAKGIPVITTKASGLECSERVIVVEIGDYDALKRAVKEELTRSTLVGAGRDLSLHG